MNLSKGEMIENHKILNNYYATVCMCISTLPNYLSVNVFNKNAFQYFCVSLSVFLQVIHYMNCIT